MPIGLYFIKIRIFNYKNVMYTLLNTGNMSFEVLRAVPMSSVCNILGCDAVCFLVGSLDRDLTIGIHLPAQDNKIKKKMDIHLCLERV
jgi:hypothetical protein